jgi:hypothetical protein
MNGMKYNWRLGHALAYAILLTFLLNGRVGAAIVFKAVGNDLDVTFTSPVSFAVIKTATWPEYGIEIEDAFRVKQSVNYANHLGDAAMALSASTISVLGNNGGTINSTVGEVDPTDLFLFWDFGQAKSLTIGNIVVVGPGTRTIPGFILKGGPLPDTGASALQITLVGSAGEALSVPLSVSVVPEPSTLLLLGIGAISLHRHRKARLR